MNAARRRFSANGMFLFPLNICPLSPPPPPFSLPPLGAQSSCFWCPGTASCAAGGFCGNGVGTCTTVTGLAPTSSPLEGTVVTVSGSGFAALTDSVQCSFAGTVVAAVVVNDTAVTCNAPVVALGVGVFDTVLLAGGASVAAALAFVLICICSSSGGEGWVCVRVWVAMNWLLYILCVSLRPSFIACHAIDIENGVSPFRCAVASADADFAPVPFEVYDCAAAGASCETCAAAAATRPACGWCPTTGECTVDFDCPSSVLAGSGVCPAVTGVSPSAVATVPGCVRCGRRWDLGGDGGWGGGWLLVC